MFRQTLFTAGTGGHACYRIPTLIALPSGRLIVFCEARTNGAGDCGTIRIVARISDDNGATFGRTIDVADNGINTLSNPVPVYDNETKTLFLLVNGNLIDGDERAIMRGEAPRTVLCTSSSDDGLTWSPVHLEHTLPDPVCQGSTLYAPKLGRLLFSNVAHPVQRVRLTLRSSADLGQSWSEGVVLHEGPSAYSDIAELADGRIACIFECGSEDPYEQIELVLLDPREVV